jgi:hypothetical protein
MYRLLAAFAQRFVIGDSFLRCQIQGGVQPTSEVLAVIIDNTEGQDVYHGVDFGFPCSHISLFFSIDAIDSA